MQNRYACYNRPIKGSAVVALHCCKARSEINRKMENSTPCKIITLENFILKLGTRDYVDTRPDSSLRYRRYINHLLTYLLTRSPTSPTQFLMQIAKQVKYIPFVTFFLSCPALSFFTARRNARIASALYCYGNSVRPSVCHTPVLRQRRSTGKQLCRNQKNIPQGRPLPLKSWFKLTYPVLIAASLHTFYLQRLNGKSLGASEQGSIMTNRKSYTRAFQRAINQGSTPPLTFSKWGSNT